MDCEFAPRAKSFARGARNRSSLALVVWRLAPEVGGDRCRGKGRRPRCTAIIQLVVFITRFSGGSPIFAHMLRRFALCQHRSYWVAGAARGEYIVRQTAYQHRGEIAGRCGTAPSISWIFLTSSG